MDLMVVTSLELIMGLTSRKPTIFFRGTFMEAT
jgi:hypothetical protein